MTVTATSRAPGARNPQVIVLTWEQFGQWLSGKLASVKPEWWGRPVKLPPAWEPGQHMALAGPTGEGKTTFAVGLLKTRKYVMVLDPKGRDDTLEAAGWQRITSLPPPKSVQKKIEKGHPARLILGGDARTDEQDIELQRLMREGIAYCRHSGGWTLYADEFELLSSQRMYRLGPAVERMLITARRDKTSVVTSFQAPAWVSKHSTRQATFTCVWPTRDRNMVKNCAESMGRDWRTLAQLVDGLPPFHVAVVPKQIRSPVLVVKPPKVGN